MKKNEVNVDDLSDNMETISRNQKYQNGRKCSNQTSSKKIPKMKLISDKIKDVVGYDQAIN